MISGTLHSRYRRHQRLRMAFQRLKADLRFETILASAIGIAESNVLLHRQSISGIERALPRDAVKMLTKMLRGAQSHWAVNDKSRQHRVPRHRSPRPPTSGERRVPDDEMSDSSSGASDTDYESSRIDLLCDSESDEEPLPSDRSDSSTHRSSSVMIAQDSEIDSRSRALHLSASVVHSSVKDLVGSTRGFAPSSSLTSV